jgi:hypothetical protein
MSDFLTNLVMRSFAQTPSVQPVTLSTYAAPEQLPIEDFAEPVPSTKPRPKTETIQTTNKRELIAEDAPLTETPSPVAQQHFERNSELPQPEPARESVFSSPAKLDNTIAPPVLVQKIAAPLIVEQVVERVTERPTVKSIDRPTVTTIKHSTTEIIDRPSITTIERAREHLVERSVEHLVEHSSDKSSTTIENTEHVTNSFTRLVPKVTPQPLPVARNLKPNRLAGPQPAAPDEQQQPTPVASPDTVINVAIGRIEVRATPAPTTRRERRQGPKVMTLDDYVQQRSRGNQ